MSWLIDTSDREPAPERAPAPELSEQADLDLTRRAIHGAWTSLFIFLALAIFTAYFQEHPRTAFPFAGTMGLIICLRLGCYQWRNRPAGPSRRMWRGLYFATIVLMGLCWGTFYAATVLIYGYGHWTTLLLLMCVAGVAAGATTSFAPHLPIMRGFLIALVGPSLAVTAKQMDGHGYAMALLLSVYLAFSLIQGRRRHAEYWSALSDRQLLRIRAEQLEKAKLAAEASSRAKSEFLANISHELRTPMNGVIGMTNLTLATGLTTYQRDNLQTVKLAAESLLHLLNDLLDFSKIEAGKVVLEKIPFSLREILSLSVKPFEVLARGKGLEVRVEAQEAIPDTLVGDPERLRQILMNLVANAVKFTDRGEVRVAVELVAEEPESVELRFSVLDTGVGIPAAKHEVVFDPFAQADGSITRRFGGTGLGLTISARLSELIGGRIWFESEVGQGSRFHVQAKFGIGANPSSTARTAEPADAVSPSRKLNILLVEDNQVNRKLVMVLLRKRGHEVTLAVNGKEAIEAVEQRPFDLILMDVQMPVMGGIEATAILREREKQGGPRIPIIALTAHAMAGDREHFLSAGMDGYLAKPIDERTLLERIAEHTGRR